MAQLLTLPLEHARAADPIEVRPASVLADDLAPFWDARTHGPTASLLVMQDEDEDDEDWLDEDDDDDFLDDDDDTDDLDDEIEDDLDDDDDDFEDDDDL